ncbi:glycosyltransferase family 4 protein [Crocosphaera sp.]|uniref:glycosyltransferase family 4 protein n=1 Tax=Crocosphaera sp. TaxID=2729996 RepID=UPI003F1FBAC0|nr:glycosyltransferase family 4 protein [Crocosphaera sp.]
MINIQNKKILVITSVYPLTDDGRDGAFIRETVVRLQSTGAKFDIFAPAYEACPTHELDGCRVYRFRYCPKLFENLVRDGAPSKLQKQPLYYIPAALYILLGTLQLFWVCWKTKPDLLHVNWPFPHGLMAWPTSKILRIPMVFTFHGTELLLAKKLGFVGHILRWLLPQASVVTANSTFTKGLIESLAQVPVTIIPYGLTIEPKPCPERSPEAIPSLLFVGRLIERKGLKYLLEALPLVLKERPVKLRIAGKGDREAEFKNLCRSLNLNETVEFLGFLSRSALAQEYANCDIFVFPSIVDSKGESEGLGIVAIEALAHQKPVIATANGGIPDIIIGNETGLLVPEKEPTALAQGILQLLSDPQQAAIMGKAGSAHIQKHFSWDLILPQWETVFELSGATKH